jgi:2'-hydroxyisoflavone reductase
MIRLVERQVTGIFNATGPARQLSFGEVLDTSLRVSGSQAQIHWVETEFLLSQGLQPWSDLPLWLPGPEYAGSDHIDIQKAVSSGLSFRSLETTIRDTLAWQATRPADYEWKAGLRAEREAEVLAAWRKEPEHSGKDR